jgi:hypothetical protein
MAARLSGPSGPAERGRQMDGTKKIKKEKCNGLPESFKSN